MGALVRRALAVAALGACSLAQAGVLDFEQAVGPALQYAGNAYQLGKYMIQPDGFDAQPGDLVGALIKGTDDDFCANGLSCPANNASTYYAGLNDGGFFLWMADGSLLSLKSFNASFIGNGQVDALGGFVGALGLDAAINVVDTFLAYVPGPAAGQFEFAPYATQAFGDELFSYIYVYAYACNAVTGICVTDSGLANFAIDDIVTTDPVALPEPASLAMVGAGLLGLVAALRRRAA